ncbi:MAG: hypothetical protein A2236_12360 [Bacteroidetes bacterium RIFOXYA2_FULL_33_7]|nr:MAG: hypothetical protein A2265_00840 [Bacteroidetes bacterium RIFOXYA12_FULL_33_9]OFY88685.1 MAG: hypothetical protein A2236_12360 [Bacteroidetes bacterium RIFOXYA2_FULL_33_7]
MDYGFLIGGTTFDLYTGWESILLIKSDYKGDTIWTKVTNLSSTGGEGVESVIQLEDSNFMVAGYFQDTSQLQLDGFLMKISNSGEVLWFKQYGDTLSDSFDIVRETNDAGFVMIGNSYSFGNGSSDIYLVKTNSAGELQWQKKYGGDSDDFSENIVSTYDGGYLISGKTYSYELGGSDLYLVKIDSAGNFQWDKTCGTIYSEGLGYAIQASDTSYVIVGTSDLNNTGIRKAMIIKTDSLGNEIWRKYYGYEGSASFSRVVELNDGSFIASGSCYYNDYTDWEGWLMKIDLNGDSIWSKRYGNSDFATPDYFYDMTITNDGGFVMSGQWNRVGTPYRDMWLVKTDSLGNTCVPEPYSPEGCWSYLCENIYAEITADSDTVYLTEGASVQFGTISNFGTSWQWDFGDTITSTEQYPQHSYTSTGVKTVQLITNSDYCSDTAYYTITVLNDVGNNNQFSIVNFQLLIYPNPATNELKVKREKLKVGCKIELYDLLGRKVLSKELQEQEQIIDVSKIGKGVYLYNISRDGLIVESNKLIVN